MGRLVAVSTAVDAQSQWAKGTAHQRFLNSCALGVFVAAMFAYALAGLVFGYLPVFLLEDFVMLRGLPAVLVALGTGVLAAGWGSHLVQRHWSTASPQVCAALRKASYLFLGVSWGAAILIAVLVRAGMKHLDIPAGLAPDADWMLLPLPWIWQYFLPLAEDGVVRRLVFVGVASVAVGLFFTKLTPWPKPALMFYGVAVCMLGAYFLGDASLQYAAARSTAGGAPSGFAREFRANPGLYNVWTFLFWVGGLATLAFGTLLTAGTLLIPDTDLKDLR